MAAPFKPGPIQEPITAEQAPKRKPGPAKGTPRPPRPASPARASLKTQIAGMLMTINLAFYVIPPLRVDVLDEVEIEALARALEEQAKQSPRFRKALETALAAGSGGTLVGVAAIIGARRAARHGILPADIDPQLGNLLAVGLDASRAKAAADA